MTSDTASENKHHPHPQYEVTPYREVLGGPVPWATRVSNQRIIENRFRAAKRYSPRDKDANADFGMLLIACEKGTGKMMGDYLADQQIIHDHKDVPIVYAPDSALPMAEGMALSCKKHHIVHRVFAMTGEQFGKDVREWKKLSYSVPAGAVEMARSSGVLVLCEGTIDRGSTLLAALRSIPDDFDGRVLITASQELVGNSNFLSSNTICPTPLVEEIRRINNGSTDKKFHVDLFVSHRMSARDDLQIPDVGDTIQAVYVPGRPGLHSMGERLTKRSVNKDSAKDRAI